MIIYTIDNLLDWKLAGKSVRLITDYSNFSLKIKNKHACAPEELNYTLTALLTQMIATKTFDKISQANLQLIVGISMFFLCEEIFVFKNIFRS